MQLRPKIVASVYTSTTCDMSPGVAMHRDLDASSTAELLRALQQPCDWGTSASRPAESEFDCAVFTTVHTF
eukprot:285907-Pleurochrysis_carterae.AAC.1